jgi:cell division protein FtsI/penicillin-binding protein 2
MGVAGKTGTLGSDEGTHSWFTGFAPSRAPEVVVAVLLENGSPWRTTAKAIAAEVLKNYFDGNRDAQDPIRLACGD